MIGESESLDLQNSGFSECEQYDDVGHPLRQGDVIRTLVDERGQWDQLGVVVTADCDLARSKHNGLVNYVPLVPVRAYLRDMWAEPRVLKSLDDLADRLVSMMLKLQKSNRADFGYAMNRERALAWLREVGSAEVLRVLRSSSQKDIDKYHDLASRYLTGSELSGSSLDEVFLWLCEYRFIASGHKPDVAAKSYQQQMLDFLRTLPGDAMFLGHLEPQMSDRGFVAYLRLVHVVDESKIALRPSERHDRSFRRVARLRSPFVYRLTQQLGDVFASIGLPTEYEAHRDRISEISLAQIGGVSLWKP